jgi:hypothetical protein
MFILVIIVIIFSSEKIKKNEHITIFNQIVSKIKEITEGRKWQKFCPKVIGVLKNGQK